MRYASRKERLAPTAYAGYHFPTAIIASAMWRYCRFALRSRDVAERLAERGVIGTDETIRRWCQKFGQADANTRRRRRPRPSDTWQLDAVFIALNGATHSLWRAVDRDGTVLDSLVRRRRNQAAAKEPFRTLLKGLPYVPRVVSTDTLASDGAAHRAMLPSVAHRRQKGLNNRAEHAHQPTRQRERRMRRCTSPGHAQRCLAAAGPSTNHCRPRRHRRTAHEARQQRDQAFARWRAVAGGAAAA